ncbi:MAG TPA: alpha/beta fold hydrolase [Thermoanaerobaculia bacterium]|nr:alpha/beta fold hydrolase [Thermoanaerobaculia bacterium]
MTRGPALSDPAPGAASPIPVRTADGWTIHLHRHPPGGDASQTDPRRPVLLLSPGMMLSGRSLDRPRRRGMASWLAARGHAVYLVDLRGHGASRPAAAEGGDWTYDEIVAFDVPAAVEAAAALHPGRPLVWIGHSLSAHAGAAAFGQRPDLPLAAAVLISPVVWIRRHEPSVAVWAAKRLTLAAWWGLTRAVGYTPARRLRIGSDDEAPGYVRQFVEWAKADAWMSRPEPPGPPAPWRGRVDYLAGLARVRFPVLVVNARGDRWIARTPCVRRFAAAFVAAPVEFLELGRRELGTRREPGHMTLVKDPVAEAAWRAIAEWIDRLPAAP